MIGSDVHIKCSVSGKPLPDITWRRNGELFRGEWERFELRFLLPLGKGTERRGATADFHHTTSGLNPQQAPLLCSPKAIKESRLLESIYIFFMSDRQHNLAGVIYTFSKCYIFINIQKQIQKQKNAACPE